MRFGRDGGFTTAVILLPTKESSTSEEGKFEISDMRLLSLQKLQGLAKIRDEVREQQTYRFKICRLGSKEGRLRRESRFFPEISSIDPGFTGLSSNNWRGLEDAP